MKNISCPEKLAANEMEIFGLVRLVAAVKVQVNNTEENLTDIEGLPTDLCCKKCFDLEIRLQEALKVLGSTHLIVEMLRNDLDTGSELTGKQCGSSDVKTKNIQCDPTKKLHVKSQWSDVVAGRSIDRRNEDTTLKQIFQPNITSPSTEEQWKTVSRGCKKPFTVNHASFYQIQVIANHYELLRNKGNDEQMVCELMKTRAGSRRYR